VKLIIPTYHCSDETEIADERKFGEETHVGKLIIKN
jgi:hypothetical protein